MRCVAIINQAEFLVESFEIEEAVSIGLKCTAVITGSKKINVGNQVKLSLNDAFWIGIVESIVEFYTGVPERFHYYITFCSKLEYYCRSTKYAIYENMNMEEIIETLIPNVGYHLKSGYQKKYEYLTQYEENNLNLLQYLIADNHMYYYLDHNLDCIIITDSSRLNIIELELNNVKQPEEIHSYIDQIKIFYESQIKQKTTFGFNMKRPEIRLYATLETEKGVGETVEYRTDLYNMDEVNARNKYLSKQCISKYIISTHSPHIRAGSEVSIKGGKFSGKYFVNKVKHNYTIEKYSNQVTISSSFLPNPIPSLKKVSGIQTATVSSENFLSNGKIKVVFHWEHSNRNKAYIPLLSANCGNDWGATVVPKSGQRVAIAFENGDASRPFICGAFYDGSHLPPYGNNEYITSFKSQNNNEVMVNDTPNEEEILVKAAKNLKEEIDNNKLILIKKGNFEKKIQKGSALIHLDSQVDSVEYKIKIVSGNSITEIESGSSIIKICRGAVNLEVSDGDIMFKVKQGQIVLSAPSFILKSNEISIDSTVLKINNKKTTITSEEVEIQASSDLDLVSPSIRLQTIR